MVRDLCNLRLIIDAAYLTPRQQPASFQDAFYMCSRHRISFPHLRSTSSLCSTRRSSNSTLNSQLAKSAGMANEQPQNRNRLPHCAEHDT